jgi:ribosome-associated translation inhibitor RaiA
MAAKSFYENLVIETEEQCQAILKAFDDAENRIERRTNPTSDELIAESERLLKEGYFDDFFL